MIRNETHKQELLSPNQKIDARVELFNGSTLVYTLSSEDRIIDFTVERVGENKFFGFGVSHKLNLNLIDINRELEILKSYTIKVYFGVKGDYLKAFPVFYIEDVKRDETSNAINITAYDAIVAIAEKHTFNELNITPPFDFHELLQQCAPMLGAKSISTSETSLDFGNSILVDANYNGEENLRVILNDMADASQTIYFMDSNDSLIVKRLSLDNGSPYTITRDYYSTLETKGAVILNNICYVNNLGNAIVSTRQGDGITQYIRDNGFLELNEDTAIAEVVESAALQMGGLSIEQFECEWAGNYLVELGDALSIETESGDYITTFLLEDTITYDGTLLESSSWIYEETETESAENPADLGDILNQTTAKIDKVNKEITITAKQVEQNTETASELILTTNTITATVEANKHDTDTKLNDINENIVSLKTSITQTEKDITFKVNSIEEQIENGVSKVKTETGFKFDNTGLTVSKDTSEISTQITEDGMRIFREDDVVLTADNQGVNATNLRATTFLIIGGNSRFETYEADSGEARTACFWIGMR